MDADHDRAQPRVHSALRRPLLLPDGEASGSCRSLAHPEDGEQEVNKAGHCSNKAIVIILSLQFLEITAFYGVYLSLIVYLQNVLHGDSASNVATVSSWVGACYLMPVLGAAVADSCWGKYTTVLVSLSISFVGMVMITVSATLPALRPPPCALGAHCAPATVSQELVFFVGIYLCAIGIGGAKAVLVSFGAEQFDDAGGENASERERKASYFSWYYAVANLGIFTAGTLLVWVEDKVGWGLGYGMCASFVAVAVVVLAATAPMYRVVPPVGSPLKGVLQVLVAFSRKAQLAAPDDASQLFEEERVKNSSRLPVHERLEHTEQFRFFDKAAIVTDEDMEDGDPWRLCTVTQVEELKTLLRLIPIWLTSAVYFIANTQAQTTFVQQGTRTDARIGRGAVSVSVPAASLTSIETLSVAACVTLYNNAVAPLARRCLGSAEAFSPLQLMGFGHAMAAAAVTAAACSEARRLEMARAGVSMSIAWLLPQYLVMAVSDASLTVGQLEFFYGESPETMKGASTAFYFLSISIGNLLNSQLVTLAARVTGAGGGAGWFPPDLDDGHLDYFFLLVVGVMAVNFAVYVALAKNYTPKRVRCN